MDQVVTNEIAVDNCKQLIPNFNSLATIIDRLIVENIKCAHFEYLLEETLEMESDRRSELQEKIEIQTTMRQKLRDELATRMKSIYLCREYSAIRERRTFE